MFKDPVTAFMLKKIDEREKLLCEEEAQLLEVDTVLNDAKRKHYSCMEKVQQQKVLINNYEHNQIRYDNYKARMKKYEWIDNLLQTTTQFFRYLLPNRFQ